MRPTCRHAFTYVFLQACTLIDTCRDSSMNRHLVIRDVLFCASLIILSVLAPPRIMFSAPAAVLSIFCVDIGIDRGTCAKMFACLLEDICMPC